MRLRDRASLLANEIGYLFVILTLVISTIVLFTKIKMNHRVALVFVRLADCSSAGRCYPTPLGYVHRAVFEDIPIHDPAPKEVSLTIADRFDHEISSNHERANPIWTVRPDVSRYMLRFHPNPTLELASAITQNRPLIIT